MGDEMFDFSMLDVAWGGSGAVSARGRWDDGVQRVWAVSDIHTDAKENMEFVSRIDARAHIRDVLLVAGDISDNLAVVRRTLRGLRQKFARVFFVAGNHELWVRSPEDRAKQLDSLGKLAALEDICAEEGVDTRPQRLHLRSGSGGGGDRGLWIVPLLSWHSPCFDTEPEIDPRWKGLPSAAQVCSDYRLCIWQPPLTDTDGSVAQRLDAMNDERLRQLQAFARRDAEALFAGQREPGDIVVSFSHFLPRIELLPEKRYLFFPSLAKFAGSPWLGRRVDQLRPDVHVFGHTHFGWDQEIAGVRYISPPVGMPRERAQRMTTVSTGNFLESEHLDRTPEPVLIWGEVCGFPPKYEAGWSGFYEEYPREPEQVVVLPDYVADLYEWDEEAWGPKAQVVGWAGKKPAWSFGPSWALRRFHRHF